MKIYTEEQVNKIATQSMSFGSYDNSITPIEISDNQNIYTEQEIKETLKRMGLDLLVNEFLKKAEPIQFNQTNGTSTSQVDTNEIRN
jgi:hypothetical protein